MLPDHLRDEGWRDLGYTRDRHHPNCKMVLLEPGEQICTKDYPPAVAFHPARLARLDFGPAPAPVLFELA